MPFDKSQKSNDKRKRVLDKRALFFSLESLLAD